MKTRVLAAVALLPLLLLIVLAAPKILTAVLFGIMAVIGAYELLSGTGLVKSKRLVIYSSVMALVVALYSYFRWDTVWIQLAVLVFWILLFAEMMIAQLKLPFEKTMVCFSAGVLIPYLLTALVRIHGNEDGRFLILIPFVLAFLSDTGAYFAGRAFGKHKLAPLISPKKTAEGVIGGILGAVLGMLLYCLVLQIFFQFDVNYLYALVYGVLGSVGVVSSGF